MTRWMLTAVAAAAALVAQSGSAADTSGLGSYLAKSRATVPAAKARVATVTSRIDELAAAEEGWLPLAVALAASCRKVAGYDGDGRLLVMLVPASLRARHLGLARAYSAARDGCRDLDPTLGMAIAAMRRSIVTRNPDDALAAVDAIQVAIGDARAFGRRLRSWSKSVSAWRFSVLQQAAAAQTAVPGWVRAL